MRGLASVGQFGFMALGALLFSGILASGCSAGDNTDELNDEYGTIPQGLTKCAGGTNGASDYCSATCLCAAGEGDCDGNAQCQAGLVCKAGAGPKYGLGSTVDVCVDAVCANGIWDLNECGIDCGGTSTCGVCSIVKLTKNCGGTNGGTDYCRNPNFPCAAGEGDCHNTPSYCQTGLNCKVGAGPQFGLPTGIDVCVGSTCTNKIWDANECGIDCGGTSSCGTCSIPKLSKGCGGTNGGTDYCINPNQKCNSGEGDCDSNAECADGLTCVLGAGTRFGLGSVDVCLSSGCTNGVWDVNECGVDCGGTSGCGTCSNPKLSKGCGGTNGGTDYCINPNQLCASGEGDCDSDAQCATGLVCATGAGPRFGLGATVDVCVSSTCNNKIQDANEGGIDCGGTSDCGACTSVGQLSYAKVFGGIGEDEGRRLVVDNSGNVYLTGSMSGTVDFGGGPLTSAGGRDVFLAKFDANGNHVWSKIFGDESVFQFGLGITLDGSGNVIITGYFTGDINFGGSTFSTPNNDENVFVAKFNSAGTHIWSNAFGEPTTNQLGWAVKADASGNVYVSGHYRNTIDFGGGPLPTTTNWDAFVAKFSPGGAHIWSKNFGGSGTDQTQCRTITVNSTGTRVAISGQFDGSTTIGSNTFASPGMFNGYVAVLDASNGNPIQSIAYGDAADQHARQVAFDPSGNLFLLGYVQGTSNLGCGAITSAGGYDTLFAKFDSNLGCIFSNLYGDSADQLGDAIAVDPFGRVAIGGAFSGTMAFGTTSITSAGGSDNYVVKLQADGTPIWVRRVGDGANQRTWSVAIEQTSASRVYATGSFGGTINFGSGNFTSAGDLDIFLVRYLP